MNKKIPIHSVTDLITNSSTTIFTYSEGSEIALCEMIDEIFKIFGINKKCEDVFDTVILCNDSYKYSEYIDELEESELPEGITKETNINELFNDVQKGKVIKPDWFKTVESSENSYDYFTPSTYLNLVPKLPEYEKLADLVTNFLYSTNHDATRDG
jgi:hypothetical protein